MTELVASSDGVDLKTRWFRSSENVKPRGVALVIHGLNLNPDRMAASIAVLNAAGVDCLRLSLRGHGDNFRQRQGMDADQSRLEAFKEVSHALWLEEALTAYSDARQSAGQNRLPLFLVGYSYGGLIGLDLLASRTDVEFERTVLLAPALSLRGWDYAVRLFSPFPKLVLPTFGPEGYAANPGIPIAGYNVLFETLDHFETHIGPRINIPTLVVIDPGDELVAFKGLTLLAEEHRLDQWRFFPVRRSRSLVRRMSRHIVIDETSVGREVWAVIQAAMVAHLIEDPS